MSHTAPPSDIFCGRWIALLKQVTGRKNLCLIERKKQIQQSSCLNLMTSMTENLSQTVNERSESGQNFWLIEHNPFFSNCVISNF